MEGSEDLNELIKEIKKEYYQAHKNDPDTSTQEEIDALYKDPVFAP